MAPCVLVEMTRILHPFTWLCQLLCDRSAASARSSRPAPDFRETLLPREAPFRHHALSVSGENGPKCVARAGSPSPLLVRPADDATLLRSSHKYHPGEAG